MTITDRTSSASFFSELCMKLSHISGAFEFIG